MRIEGTEKEIEWIKDTLRNNCANCPYMEPCDQGACEDQEKYGEVRHSCSDFLSQNIEFIVMENNI